jgi:transcriptional regulator with XRE-family HTH domain
MTTKKRYGSREFEAEYGPLTFGEALEGYRLGEELSQIDLARELKISAQSLCDLEKGRRIPTPQRAARIARLLGRSEKIWIKLALQDELRKGNLNFTVTLAPCEPRGGIAAAG